MLKVGKLLNNCYYPWICQIVYFLYIHILHILLVDILFYFFFIMSNKSFNDVLDNSKLINFVCKNI